MNRREMLGVSAMLLIGQTMPETKAQVFQNTWGDSTDVIRGMKSSLVIYDEPAAYLVLNFKTGLAELYNSAEAILNLPETSKLVRSFDTIGEFHEWLEGAVQKHWGFQYKDYELIRGWAEGQRIARLAEEAPSSSDR